jgi:N-hydroxyarylamine O-acetyltransferase
MQSRAVARHRVTALISHPPVDERPLPAPLRDAVCARLGLTSAPPTLVLLNAVYGAWCRRVPFDNVRKLIALREGDAAPLPGTHAIDFFEQWLAHGTGGTCWSSSNALYMLLAALGFTARRIAGSMRDLGVITHGSTVVTINGRDWLADSSALTQHPVPLFTGPYCDPDPAFATTWDTDGDTHLLRFGAAPGPEHTVCRFMIDHIDHAYLDAAHERSRGFGRFNEITYARRNVPDGFLVLSAAVRYHRTAAGTAVRPLDRDALRRVLLDDFGISPTMMQRYEACGALEANFAPVGAA